MTSRIRRRVAMLAVLPVTVTVLGFGLSSPALASDESCGTCSSPGGGTEQKIVDAGDTGRALLAFLASVF